MGEPAERARPSAFQKPKLTGDLQVRGVNKAILVGNLGKDPELRYTQSGTPVANFSLATSRRWRDKDGQDQEQTEWHNIVIWSKLAEIAGEYLRKGSPVYLEGRIQTRNYDDQSGQKRYITEIVVDEMVMLGSRGDGNIAPRSDGPPLPDEPPDMGGGDGGGGGGTSNDDDDLPF